MRRRFQEIEARKARSLNETKATLKSLGDRERAFLIAWLCKFYADDGGLFSPQISKQRRTVIIDAAEFWLVRIPKKRASSRNQSE